MKMELHTYQNNCINDLMAFFAKTKALELEGKSDKPPSLAFYEATDRPYYAPPSVNEKTPFVCVRIPTGGGKTLMAAHALAKIGKEYLDCEKPLCLWLAPSKAVVTQTLRALKTPGHPCLRAMQDSFGGDVNCISIVEAMALGKGEMDDAATVIVCTVQLLRVEETEGRKIYGDNGQLMSHFESLPKKLRKQLDSDESGEIFQSLANAIKLRRPIVISDEAHNSDTALSFKTLARFDPSCIVEWTATPQTERIPGEKYPSNVISQASARELKAAGMIKFPIHMRVVGDWRDNIREAVAKREELEKAAKKERKKTGENIRPIVLYQAEDVRGKANKQAVKEMLAECGVPPEHVAEHSGNVRELANVNLLSDNCDLRHIITVKALAEGWDCSFAYILCTMANMKTPKAVEQILGRILRLPNAARKKTDALNECHAFVAEGDVYRVAKALKDTLVKKSGFQTMEANEFVAPPPSHTPPLLGGEAGVARPKPKKAVSLAVPMLMVRDSGNLEFLEAEHFLGAKWSIAGKKPDMSGFTPPRRGFGSVDLDVDEEGKIVATDYHSAEGIREQLTLIAADKKWTKESLAVWLDCEIYHPDIPQTHSSPFILSAITLLLRKHKLEALAAWRFYVKAHLEKVIDGLRREKRKQGWQQMLSAMAVEDGKLEVSAKHALEFERRHYTPHWPCPAGNIFRKHIFDGEVGELKDSGEEWDCARFLDGMPEVKAWVRNLEKRDNAFWLQTPSDRFYPDFVCLLTDGRIMVVEYKGYDRWSDDDSKEKREIGDVWAKLSKGQCLFVMPKGPDWNAIKKCVRKKKA